MILIKYYIYQIIFCVKIFKIFFKDENTVNNMIKIVKYYLENKKQLYKYSNPCHTN